MWSLTPKFSFFSQLIQCGHKGHSSAEDAKATLDLVRLKLSQCKSVCFFMSRKCSTPRSPVSAFIGFAVSAFHTPAL